MGGGVTLYLFHEARIVFPEREGGRGAPRVFDRIRAFGVSVQAK